MKLITNSLAIGQPKYTPVIEKAIALMPKDVRNIFNEHMFIAYTDKGKNIIWSLTKAPQSEFNSILYSNKYISNMQFNGRSGAQHIGNPGFKFPDNSFIMTKSEELNKYLAEHLPSITQAVSENLIVHGDKIENIVEMMRYLGIS